MEVLRKIIHLDRSLGFRVLKRTGILSQFGIRGTSTSRMHALVAEQLLQSEQKQV